MKLISPAKSDTLNPPGEMHKNSFPSLTSVSKHFLVDLTDKDSLVSIAKRTVTEINNLVG